MRPCTGSRHRSHCGKSREDWGKLKLEGRAWQAEHRARIEAFYLPAYSAELNPDEGLNADLKQAIARKAPACSKQHLKQVIISNMRRLTKLPARVRSYFRHKPVRYAA